MRKLVQWFVENPIAANLLMIAMMVGGYVGSSDIKKEVFPITTRNVIQVTMAYPGAAPAEIEQQIVVRIEDAIANMPGIYQVTSESSQGSGRVNIDVIDGYDVKDLLSEVKSRVDSINTFPTSAERSVIRELVNRPPLLYFAMWGDEEADTMKQIAYEMRDELSMLDGVSEVRLTGVKNDEVAIEISEKKLREYGLTFSAVAAAVRQSSLDLPAGTIKTAQGEIQVQTRAQAYRKEDFAKIVIRSNEQGGELLLSDIAEILDAFEERDVAFNMNGKPGINFEVKMSDDPDLFGGTEQVREYLDEYKKRLPDTLELKINYESKSMFDSRFNLLKDNAVSGLLLVFIVLMLFLRPVVALWVVAGIIVSFAGAVWLLPYSGISLNMLSMFAFIMVLGIVVDDAIIVGESIYSHHQQGLKGKSLASVGTNMVLKPVFLAVFSTIMFFLPMVGVPSDVKPYTLSIFYVVFFCLLFSLIESIFILPSHLAHMKEEKTSRFASMRKLAQIREMFSSAMENFAANKYRPLLDVMLHHKVSALLGFLMVLCMAVAVYAGGWIATSFFPNVAQPFLRINVNLPEGAPYSQTERITQHILEQVESVQMDKELLEKNNGELFIREYNATTNGTNLSVFVAYTPPETRNINSDEIKEHIRKAVGPIPEAKQFSLSGGGGDGQPDIQLNLSLGTNEREMQKDAVAEVSKILAAYPGVSNVRSNLDTGRVEVEVGLKPYASTLDISLRDIASQVRRSFYGEEIQRIPRDNEDVRVMLRYPRNERDSLDSLDNLRVRTADQAEIPLDEVAEINLVPGTSVIRRIDRKRNITITADVEEGGDANQIVNEMLKSYMPVWKEMFVGFSLSTDGSLKTQAIFGEGFAMNFVKVFILVWGIFMVAFRSVFQPILVLLAIPFGLVGAIFGHLLMGYNINLMSFFGLLACSGVVVNDNLVLLDRINQLRQQGRSVYEAVLNAGVDRFRPIILTSLTTFVGLLPILFEQSNQAKFLMPMVISLAFGVMLSSTVTLFFVPCAYMAGSSIGKACRRYWRALTVSGVAEISTIDLDIDL